MKLDLGTPVCVVHNKALPVLLRGFIGYRHLALLIRYLIHQFTLGIILSPCPTLAINIQCPSNP